MWVGGSSFKAILGNKIAPGYLDRYLARFGYTSQYSPAPANRDAPDNLFKPTEGDFGAHGRFDNEARARVALRTPIFPWLAAVSGALAAFLILAMQKRPGWPGIPGTRAFLLGALAGGGRGVGYDALNRDLHLDLSHFQFTNAVQFEKAFF